MEAAKERRSSSLLPPLSYETFDTFFEAKKQQNAHIRPIFTATAHTNLYTGPQRENFPGGTKVDTGPPNLIGPLKPYRGPCR